MSRRFSSQTATVILRTRCAKPDGYPSLPRSAGVSHGAFA